MAHSTKATRTTLLFTLLLLIFTSTALSQQVTENKVLTLLKHLDDKDRETSHDAAAQLKQFGLEAVPHLIKALKHRDSRIRSNAASTLGEIGPAAKDAVPDLIGALQDSDENVIHAALDGLEQMQLEPNIAIPIFINLLKSEDYYLSTTASDDLVVIGTEAIPYLIDNLKSTSAKARSMAARSLGKMKPKAVEAVMALAEALKDEDGDVRMESAEALGEIGPDSRAAIPSLINAMGDESEGVRGTAVDALKKIGPECVPQLIEAFGNKNSSVAAISIDALRKFGPDARPAIPHLTRLLLQYENEDIRTRAARALGAIGPDAIPSLLKALKDGNAEVRGCAAAGFYEMGANGEEAVPELAAALHDSNAEVRTRIAEALEKIGPAAKAAIPSLVEALKDDNKQVRGSAAQALKKIGPEARVAIPSLIDSLEDTEWNVNSDTAGALESIAVGELEDDAKAKIPKLIKALHSKNKIVRRSAAGVLGKMGPEGKTAIDALIETLEDQEEEVRNKAAESLANISVALSNAWDPDSVEPLKRAYVVLRASPYPKVREQAGLVKQSVNYLELLWWDRVIGRIRNNSSISFIVGTYVLLILVSLGMLWLRPLWLLWINEAFSSNADKLPKKIGGIDMPVRYLLVIGFFHYHPRVLDAWVSKHVAAARKAFSRKPTVEERETHIPTPIILNKETFPEVSARALAPVFSAELSYLLIWGDGGAGKTSLACLLARRAMSEEEDERLYKKHLMLPILIEQGLDLQAGDREESLLKMVGTQLRLLTGEGDKIAPELLRHLIRRRRILLIIDSLSEIDDASRSNILGGVSGLPVNACIFTSRTEEQLNGLPVSIIKMLRIKGNRLATFMETYLSYREKRDLFDDEEFFEGCRRLSSIVGERDITALIAKYYAEQMIVAKEGKVDEDLPENIPELMLKYVNIINRSSSKNAPDIHAVHRAAQVIAWECLKKTFRPAAANRSDVLNALGGEEKGGPLIKHLEETLKIIRSVGGVQAIRYTIDPLSEYFAGLHLIDRYGVNEAPWRELLNKAEQQDGAPDSIRGFLLALQDCCLAKGEEAEVPSFVVDKLANLAGVSRGQDDENAKIQRRVSQFIQRLRLPDAGDRVDAVKGLNLLNKEAKDAIPALIEALNDQDFNVRLEATYALGSIGSEAKAAAPALIASLKDRDESVRLGAAAALMKIRPISEAKSAIPILIDALKDPYGAVRRSAAFILGNIGADAQVAVPHLTELLKDLEDRRIAAEALSKIGSLTAPAFGRIAQSEDVEIQGVQVLNFDRDDDQSQ